MPKAWGQKERCAQLLPPENHRPGNATRTLRTSSDFNRPCSIRPSPRLSTDSIGAATTRPIIVLFHEPTDRTLAASLNWNHTRLRLQNLVFCGANACSDRKVMQLAGLCSTRRDPLRCVPGRAPDRSASLRSDAHNLTRELQMRLSPRARRTTAKRAALWCFREIETLRRTLIQRAGRIAQPVKRSCL